VKRSVNETRIVQHTGCEYGVCRGSDKSRASLAGARSGGVTPTDGICDAAKDAFVALVGNIQALE
jgi:hypothetical protein